MKRWIAFVCLVGLVTGAGAEDWLRVRVEVPSPAALDLLLDSGLTTYTCEPTLGTTDMALSPSQLPELDFRGLRYKVVSTLKNPYDVPGEERPQATDYRNEYFTFSEIVGFFDNLVATRPKYVRRVQIGTSIQNRPIYAYRFGGPSVLNGPPSKHYAIVGLTHAREWITGSVVMHIGKMLADSLASPSTRSLVGQRVTWIVPVVNPDGYSYTWTTNRLWRKNRRNNGGSTGVDINRNYAKGWGGQGSSGSGSSDTYRGTAPFSEPETAAVRDLVLALPNFAGFIDFHSYSQLVLWPWSYTTASPPTAGQLQSVAIALRNAINTGGVVYTQGQASTALYIAAGTSKDYVYDVRANAPSFTIELRDTGQFGFELPPSQITPTQNEAWSAMLALFEQVGS